MSPRLDRFLRLCWHLVALGRPDNLLHFSQAGALYGFVFEPVPYILTAASGFFGPDRFDSIFGIGMLKLSIYVLGISISVGILSISKCVGVTKTNVNIQSYECDGFFKNAERERFSSWSLVAPLGYKAYRYPCGLLIFTFLNRPRTHALASTAPRSSLRYPFAGSVEATPVVSVPDRRQSARCW